MINELLVRLKISRKERGFKLAKDFAAYAGVSPSTYSQHETGKRGITIENLFHYSKLLGINPSWILTGQGNPSDIDSDLPLVDSEILNKISDLERRGEIEAMPSPRIEQHAAISCIETSLFTKILCKSLVSLKDEGGDVDVNPFVFFCFELYNKLVSVNSSDDEMEILIDMSVRSFFSGVIAKNKTQLSKIS